MGDALLDLGTARATVAASKEATDGIKQSNWARNHQHQTVRFGHTCFTSNAISAIDRCSKVQLTGIPMVTVSSDHTILVAVSEPGAGQFPYISSQLSSSISTLAAQKGHLGSQIPCSRSILRTYTWKSTAFENKRRFRPQNFEDSFAKYDRRTKGGLVVWNLIRVHKKQAMVFNFFCRSAASLECEFKCH